MSTLSNSDILQLIKDRDELSFYHKNEIFNSMKISGETVHYRLINLMKCLSNPSYTLSSMDGELLEEYNIFVSLKEKKNIKENSFVVISDFHGFDYPVDKIINHYLDEYEYIYILGDATDRGPRNDGSGSLDVLLKIKELSELYPGRVIYIPGNHDSFIVGHEKNDIRSTYSMNFNKGSATVLELDDLKKNNFSKYSSLIDWLSHLPMQRVHMFEGQLYALAHAFFDNNLYHLYPDYCLEDHFRKGSSFEVGERVLWFRKSDLFSRGETIADEKVKVRERKYVKSALPPSNVIVVIGHSKTNANSREHDLVNRSGDKVTIHCVDGGIAYNGDMLKYDGGNNVFVTYKKKHHNTSQGEYEIDAASSNLKNYIIYSIYESKKEAFSRDSYLMPASISNEEFAEVVDSYEDRCGFSYGFGDYQDRYCMFKKIFVFDMIIQKLFDKYHDKNVVNFYVNGFLHGENGMLVSDPTWFSRDKDIRFFAEMLGRDNMIEVLSAYNCDNINDYINLKTRFTKEGKVKIK